MFTPNNKANNFNLGKKFHFSRVNTNNSSIKGNKKSTFLRCKSSDRNIANIDNHYNEANNLSFEYNNNNLVLNNKNINKDFKSTAKTKKGYIPSSINDNEIENKQKKSNIQALFVFKKKSFNKILKYEKNTAFKNRPITINQNYLNSQKVGIDINGNNLKTEYSNYNVKERLNSFQKKKDESLNPNQNNYNENKMSSNKFKNEEIRQKAFINKNLNDDPFKVMNNLMEKEKKMNLILILMKT